MKNTASTKPTIIPLHDRVLVKTPRTSQEEKGEQLLGGVVIPAEMLMQLRAKEIPLHIICEVLAIGPECKAVTVGQNVVVRKADLFVMSPDIIGVEQTLIFEKHIMAVVD